MIKKIFWIILILFLVSSQTQARTLTESLGYLSLHGNFEKLSWNSAGWNTAGGGFALGLNIGDPIFLECYLDYLSHINPLNNIDNPLITSRTMNSMHFGGKTVLFFGNMFLIKAGIGIANIKSQINDTPTTGNDLEMNFSIGMLVPMTNSIDFDFHFIYRRLFESPAVTLMGGNAGLLIKF
jgi:hypothetical protein